MNYFKEIDRIIGDYGFIGNRRELITKVYNAGNPSIRDTMSKEVFIYKNIEAYLKGLGLTRNLPTGKSIANKYKDSAFCILYGIPETAALLVSDILNAEYTADDIQIVTLKEFGINGRHNDLGIQIGDETVFLCEEQSSYCPNMPARMLIYYTYTLEQYIKSNDLKSKLYSSVLVKLPTPKFYVVDLLNRGSDTYSLRNAYSGEAPINLDVSIIKTKDGLALKSLSPYYEIIQFIGERKNYSNPDAVRKEFRLYVESKEWPDVIKERLLERSGDIMGVLQEEVDWDEVARINREYDVKCKEVEDIKILIKTLFELNASESVILQKLMAAYKLSKDEARAYVEEVHP